MGGWGGRKLQVRRLREREATWEGPSQAQAEHRCPWEAAGALGAQVGQCHLAPGNRRHFLGADPWLACGGGGGSTPELAMRQVESEAPYSKSLYPG